MIHHLIAWVIFASTHSEGLSIPSRYVILTEGIVGSARPPVVRSRVILTDQTSPKTSPSPVFRIAVRASRFRGRAAAFFQGTLTPEQSRELWNVLNPAVWDLPIECPFNCEDAYRFDTSIGIRDGSQFWRNGANRGCLWTSSSVLPTRPQRDAFLQLVRAIDQAMERVSWSRIPAEQFLAMESRLRRDADLRAAASAGVLDSRAYRFIAD